MDLLELVREHDSLHGLENTRQYPTVNERRIERQVGRRPSLFLSQGKKSKNLLSDWGIQYSLRWKKKSVTRKQKRLLLQQMVEDRLLFEPYSDKDLEIFQWIGLELIQNEFLKEVPSLFYIRDKMERQLVGVCLVTLMYGEWAFRETQLSLDLVRKIEESRMSGFRLSSLSTWRSRNQNYSFGDWFSLKIDVVADVETPGPGEPYSSYCKGYGMDRGQKPAQLSTPFCSELDGEEPLDSSLVLWKDHELSMFLYLVELSTW